MDKKTEKDVRKLITAIGDIDDKYIEEMENHEEELKDKKLDHDKNKKVIKIKRKENPIKSVAIAASFVIIISAAFYYKNTMDSIEEAAVPLEATINVNLDDKSKEEMDENIEEAKEEVLDKSKDEIKLDGKKEASKEKLLDRKINKATKAINPFTECEIIEDAEEIAGFRFLLPSEIRSNKITYISAIKDQMINVFYGENKDVVLRKAIGADDISGNYNVFTEEAACKIGGKDVHIKGDNGKASLVLWTDGLYSYSLDFKEAIDLEDLDEILKDIK